MQLLSGKVYLGGCPTYLLCAMHLVAMLVPMTQLIFLHYLSYCKQDIIGFLR